MTTLKRRVLAAVAALPLGLLSIVVTTDAAAAKYDGVKVNIMTFTGPQIAEPLQRLTTQLQGAVHVHSMDTPDRASIRDKRRASAVDFSPNMWATR